jgi:phosphohistidine phosphatase
MFIYIARHAWASERGDPRWPDDSLRELEPAGIKRFGKVVKALAERGFAPERIATSPYARCLQTAEIIAKGVEGKPAIDQLPALEPDSDMQSLLAWTLAQGKLNVCWVGHSPDVEQLASALVAGGSARIRFAKGAVAAIGFEGEAHPGMGELCWLATAKLLGV